MTAAIRQNIYSAWLDGEASPMEALRSLCDDYTELDDTYKQFEAMREQTRAQISHVLEKLDGKADIAGFGHLEITAPAITVGYDRAKIRALLDELYEDHPDIAARLAACQTKSARAGGLRIEREKPRDG